MTTTPIAKFRLYGTVFGQRVRRRRRRLGLTEKQVGERMGWTGDLAPGTIRQVEGGWTLNLAHMAKLAAALDTTLSRLMSGLEGQVEREYARRQAHAGPDIDPAPAGATESDR